MLHALVARLGTPDVHFLGHVTNEELTALYDVADLFLCASEHEGFCVPLDRGVLQARAGAGLRRDRRAGDDGRRRRAVRHDRIRSRSRALMDAVLDDAELEDARARVAGRRARAAAARKDFGGTLLRFVDALLRQPPRPAPEVACDFWAQFDQFERLEELRQFRPALFGRCRTSVGIGAAGSQTRARRSAQPIVRTPDPDPGPRR